MSENGIEKRLARFIVNPQVIVDMFAAGETMSFEILKGVPQGSVVHRVLMHRNLMPEKERIEIQVEHPSLDSIGVGQEMPTIEVVVGGRHRDGQLITPRLK